MTKATKPTTVSGTTTTTVKHKFSTSVNHTSSSNARLTKDKSATTNTTLTTKDKPTPLANNTTLVKPHPNSHAKASKVKPDPTAVQTGLSAEPVTASDSGASKDKPSQAVSSEPKDAEKPAPAQPIKLVISEGCDSGHTTEQEVRLKPGAPLVVAHQISLVSAGCSESCQVQMEALKVRLDRLEKEMTALKDQCMYN